MSYHYTIIIVIYPIDKQARVVFRFVKKKNHEKYMTVKDETHIHPIWKYTYNDKPANKFDIN